MEPNVALKLLAESHAMVCSIPKKIQKYFLTLSYSREKH